MNQMQLKIAKLGNHWVISQKKDGKQSNVGKISPQQKNTIFFNFLQEEAQLKEKMLSSKIVYEISNGKMIFRLKTTNLTKRNIWEQQGAGNNTITILHKQSSFVIKLNEDTLAKVNKIANTYLLKITDSSVISPAILIASIYPFF